MCGNGPGVLTHRIQAIKQRQAHWANTMGSSCATNMSCAALPARRRVPTRAAPIEIFFHRMPAGSSPASAWPGIAVNAIEQREFTEGLTLQKFRRDLLAGLSRSAKSLPCKYLYDARGARLFETISELEEYYPTRAEAGILRRSIQE